MNVLFKHIIDPNEFALAVMTTVSYDGYDRDISIKYLELYKAAYQVAEESNEKVKKTAK